jgi:hypothetical protein
MIYGNPANDIKAPFPVTTRSNRFARTILQPACNTADPLAGQRATGMNRASFPDADMGTTAGIHFREMRVDTTQ